MKKIGIGMVHGGGMKPPRMKAPTMPHIARPARVHPAARIGVRLPQGEVNTRAGDPGVYAPGVGKI